MPPRPSNTKLTKKAPGNRGLAAQTYAGLERNAKFNGDVDY